MKAALGHHAALLPLDRPESHGPRQPGQQRSSDVKRGHPCVAVMLQLTGMYVKVSCLLQAYASVQLIVELHFSNTVYGLGSGIFFLGYMVFKVTLGPSDILYFAKRVISVD